MANGSEVCCALGICCPPARAEEALAREMVKGGLSDESAKQAAKWVHDKFDLAPKGTLTELKAAIGKMAREDKDHG